MQLLRSVKDPKEIRCSRAACTVRQDYIGTAKRSVRTRVGQESSCSRCRLRLELVRGLSELGIRLDITETT